MENYGRTDTGELIGPYDTVDELNTELAASNAEAKTRTFTCNECHTTGSLRWMETHDCQGVQDVNQFGGRCEDYPCCGHLDGECAPQERFTKEYWQDRMSDPDYDPDHDYGMNG
jgi:hypothetical protein